MVVSQYLWFLALFSEADQKGYLRLFILPNLKILEKILGILICKHVCK